jgi:hypothetical protein
MPFDILSGLQLSDAPAAGGATQVDNLTAPVILNVDANGGFAEVVGALDGSIITVRYTNADGLATEAQVDMTAGFAITDPAGAVFDADAGTFTFAMSGPSAISDLTIAGLFNVAIGPDGAVSSTESFQFEVEPFIDDSGVRSAD